jgi:hypothetical protein
VSALQRMHPSVALFECLSHAVWSRHRGEASDAPDWLHPDAVQALALALDGSASTAVRIVLRDGVSAASLPRSVSAKTGAAPVGLRFVRGDVARAHRGPPRLQREDDDSSGAATALVRDRLNPERNYILSCAHLLAPRADCSQNDRVRIDVSDGASLRGSLCEWTPALGEGCPPSSIDAALLELDAMTTLKLREHQTSRAWLPSGVSDEIRPRKAIRLIRPGGVLEGSLMVRWSGRVDVGGDGYPDYFLQNAIGYVTHGDTTAPGDSGSPVWTEDERLLGMHLAGIDPESAYGASGVMGRIVPALDWFRVKPYTRLDPASLEESDRPGGGPRRVEPVGSVRAVSPGGHDRTVLAQTLWGEARGEGELGMKAVACVVLNRFDTRYRGKQTVAEVCLDPWQFSCWNLNDPNRAELDRVTRRFDASYSLALVIADLALGGRLPDITDRARHYVATSLRLRPDWLRGKKPCAVIGRHEFYNDVA